MAKTPELQRFYASKKWTSLRNRLVVERGGICERCGELISDTSQAIGHHKIELTPSNYRNPSISLNPDNVEILCWSCHSKEHASRPREIARVKPRKQVYLVWGSPLSGKTSYVRRNAEPGDLICDFDSIWEAISIAPRYEHPSSLKQAAFAIRDCLIDQIRIRNGSWLTAWIIGGYPQERERIALLTRLGAEPIYMESTREDCLQRAQVQNADSVALWMDIVNRWWDTAGGIPEAD